MEALVIVVVVLLAGGAAVALARRGRQPERERPPALTPAAEQAALHGDVRRIRPGDVVNHDGTDYIVERTMTFDEGGFTWQEHFLTDQVAGRRTWLSVEDDDGLELAFYERVTGVTLEPGPGTLTHDGVTYERDEQGRASFRTDTLDGPGESGQVEYADYAAGDRLLAFERYGQGGWEVSAGTVVSQHAIEVYPRS